MELQIYNPTEENSIKQIDWNFEDLKNEITRKAEIYGSLVYTDETIKEAKKDRANLNKFIKALEDKRKDVKRMMLEPYTHFEAQVKELVSIITDANNNIDSQVRAYEQKQREEKREKVKEIYEKAMSVEGAEGIAEILTFDRVFKESFLNSSTTFKSIVNEIEDLRDRVRHDIDVINADTGEYQFEMKQAYLKNLDMTEALSVKQQFEENARKKAEYEAKRKAEMEARRAREEAETQRLAEAGKREPIVENIEPAKTTDETTQMETVQEEIYTVAFEVQGTKKQLNDLKQFLKDNNIKFGPVQ